jgi:2-amino-4-hydroxy-6-hydroxymethyldihydropteridine diphosphokinase
MTPDAQKRERANLAYLSLGSNIRPECNLPAAVAQLAQFGQVQAVSTVWETLPVGFSDQPDFLNAAVLIETDLSAVALREEAIAAIEVALGRVRTANKNAPRTIDIDIMLFNREVIQLKGRHIPDPEVLERPFVAVPLAEIAPDYVHPETGQTLREIARQFDPMSTGMRRRGDVELPLSENS